MAYFPYFENTIPFMEYLGNKSVTLIVGPDRKEYLVHKNPLCLASPFFEKAFNGSFRESREEKMSLPEDKPEIVEAFIAWLYEQELAGDEKWENSDYLTDLYIFAGSKQCNSLKDAVINVCQDAHYESNGCFQSTHIEKIFANTEKIGNAGIWRFCAALCHFELLSGCISPQELDARFAVCPGLLLEYFQMQLHLDNKSMETKDITKATRWATPWDPSSHYFRKCYFHTHGELEACTITRGYCDGTTEDEEATQACA